MQSRDGADGVERVVLERRQLESAPEEKKEKKDQRCELTEVERKHKINEIIIGKNRTTACSARYKNKNKTSASAIFLSSFVSIQCLTVYPFPLLPIS